MHVTKIPGSALQVNNIIVMLESVINYDYVIMIIEQTMSHSASTKRYKKNFWYLVSVSEKKKKNFQKKTAFLMNFSNWFMVRIDKSTNKYKTRKWYVMKGLWIFLEP